MGAPAGQTRQQPSSYVSVKPHAWPRTRPPRIVLDTNVVVSALIFGHGVAAQMRLAWLAGRLTPLASTAAAAELARVLAHPKFKLSADEQQELLADYLPAVAVVHLPDPPPQAPPCRDPFDLPFLHLALAGRADALVTGDADLLALAGQVSFRILTPADFLAMLPAAG